jgi:all-trans-retinol 13,14-reductase
MFDVPLIIGNMRRGDPIAGLFSYIGVDKKMDFIEVDKLAKIVGPDMTIDWYTDTYKLENEFISKFSHEKKAIQKFFQVTRTIWYQIMESHYKPNFLQMMTYPVKFPLLVKYNNKTLKQMLDKFFTDEKLKEFLGAESITLGLDIERVSALFYIGYIMSYAAGGIWYPKGGFQKLSDAFADCLREYCGDIKLKTKVKKIIVEKNTAKGIELENGEKIYADYIISNADTKRTFLDMLEPGVLKQKFQTKIENLEQSISGVVVKLAVDIELPQIYNYAWLFHFPEYGSVRNMLELNDSDQINLDKYSFSIDCSSLVSDDKYSTIGLVMLPAPYNYKNKWQSDDKAEYEKLKESIADDLIKKAEEFIPDLSKHIVVKDISTPLTYERYTSATGGAWYDTAAIPEQALTNKLGPDTPIKRLYLTGAKTMLGLGLTGAIPAGLYTADTILKGALTGGKSYIKNELCKP